jgi:hypothetical protein
MRLSPSSIVLLIVGKEDDGDVDFFAIFSFRLRNRENCEVASYGLMNEFQFQFFSVEELGTGYPFKCNQ